MLPLHTRGSIFGATHRQIFKVLTLNEALAGTWPIERVMADLRGLETAVDFEALKIGGLQAALVGNRKTDLPIFAVTGLARNDVVSAGDVIRVSAGGQVQVLFRRGSNANFLFATERCNSLCLMCSQPPRAENDDWRVAEILETIPLIDDDVPQLGITGGEPTLLGRGLRDVLATAKKCLPRTRFQVLTNGRLFSDTGLADLFDEARGSTRWCIPLYADTAAQHDYVVQGYGAFEETINGLYNLAERKHSIEIRVVLHALTVNRLTGLMEFIWRTLPFVDHIALMGLEPIGFAKLNRELLWVDPLDYAAELSAAAAYLHDRGMRVSIYNVPLCVLPKNAWHWAKRSISDWKNTFAPECISCAIRQDCCGFFASADNHWRSRGIAAVSEGTA